MKKERVRRLLLVLIGLGAVGGGVWLWQSTQQKTIKEELTLYGNVDIRQAELAFNNSERIESMLVEEGSVVKKGQLLATLETDRLAESVAQAKAQVQAQREVVARLEAGSRPEEIRKARAEAEAAEAEAENAQRTYSRLKALAPQNLASEERLDDALAASKAAQAKLKAAQETLALAVAGPRKEDIAAAKATLKSYEAELALAERRLADAKLFAPEAGVIRARILEPGDMASPQAPVYTLALINPLWVRAYVPETDIGKIWPGMEARVKTDSYPGKDYRGWVGFISPSAEFTPKSVETSEVRTSLVYQVRVYVCNPENELRLGMPATVVIPLDQPHREAGSGPAPCEN